MSNVMLFWKKTINRWETVQEQEERCMGIGGSNFPSLSAVVTFIWKPP